MTVIVDSNRATTKCICISTALVSLPCWASCCYMLRVTL